MEGLAEKINNFIEKQIPKWYINRRIETSKPAISEQTKRMSNTESSKTYMGSGKSFGRVPKNV